MISVEDTAKAEAPSLSRHGINLQHN